uniref:Uncharacterized protein n=1 Tax=Steinernema glaseri TaxID=37863 RepID=A0A1I8AN79_9BILA
MFPANSTLYGTLPACTDGHHLHLNAHNECVVAAADRQSWGNSRRALKSCTKRPIKRGLAPVPKGKSSSNHETRSTMQLRCRAEPRTDGFPKWAKRLVHTLMASVIHQAAQFAKIKFEIITSSAGLALNPRRLPGTLML